MNAPLQLFSELPRTIEAALRASIKRFGVLVDVIVDQEGRVIDGHHRKRIANEEGVQFRTKTVRVESDEHARELATTLNADRRQLNEEERREMVSALREDGHSVRAIAGALGVSKSTVHKDLGQLSIGGQLNEPERITGEDGRSRPTSSRSKRAKPREAKKTPKEQKPDARDKEIEKLKAAFEDAEERRQAAAEEAKDLEDKLTAFTTTDPDEQQKEILKLQKKIMRLEAEIERLTRARGDLQNKNNELIREVKRLRKKAGE